MRLFASTLAAAGFAASGAAALDVSVNGTLDFAPVAWFDASARTLLLAQFDPGVNAPSNAELIGVKLRLDSTLRGDYTAMCFQFGPCAFTADGGATAHFVDGETTVAGPGLVGKLPLALEGGVFGTINVEAGESDVRNIDVSDFLEIDLDVAGFTGAGEVLYTLEGLGELSEFDATNGGIASFVGESNATLTLTYSYRLTGPEAVVPLPAAAPLLASGLVAFGWMRHRRRRRG